MYAVLIVGILSQHNNILRRTASQALEVTTKLSEIPGYVRLAHKVPLFVVRAPECRWYCTGDKAWQQLVVDWIIEVTRSK